MKMLIIDIIFATLMLMGSIMSAINGEWLLFSLSFTMFIFDIIDGIIDYKNWKEKIKNESNHSL